MHVSATFVFIFQQEQRKEREKQKKKKAEGLPGAVLQMNKLIPNVAYLAIQASLEVIAQFRKYSTRSCENLVL